MYFGMVRIVFVELIAAGIFDSGGVKNVHEVCLQLGGPIVQPVDILLEDLRVYVGEINIHALIGSVRRACRAEESGSFADDLSVYDACVLAAISKRDADAVCFCQPTYFVSARFRGCSVDVQLDA